MAVAQHLQGSIDGYVAGVRSNWESSSIHAVVQRNGCAAWIAWLGAKSVGYIDDGFPLVGVGFDSRREAAHRPFLSYGRSLYPVRKMVYLHRGVFRQLMFAALGVTALLQVRCVSQSSQLTETVPTKQLPCSDVLRPLTAELEERSYRPCCGAQVQGPASGRIFLGYLL